MQFAILLIGILVFVFYQFNTPPLFFNQTEVNRIEQSRYGKDYQQLENEHVRTHEYKKQHAAALITAIDADDEQEDFGEDSDVVAWCVGFIEAMYGDESVDWFDDADTEEDVAELTLPMVILSGMDEENEDLNMMRDDIDMMVQLANSLESNVTELFLLFHTND